MRTFTESLFWMLNSGRIYGRARRPLRRVRPIRPFRPIRSLFHLFWGIAWVFIGLAIAFSPEFRALFIRFWEGFAQLIAAMARELAQLLR